ncbi:MULTISPECIES: peptidoglycan DD-metalloendopeptidase family protein [Pseudoxanthomonas]|jgi:lipoprotein NlpD|nr:MULTISPECIES: peptidoglycan DD-metalloendopeptidase family protein [Pseudoxanthomonas]MBB3275094.1 lipoprotein NlpD [Pseudoxanthomonas sp. OG2]MBD9379136.1 peptidoglycan DD-metalloendopeptidase family protein [Pseudoxanthomonas sp. PXM04]MBV7473814.1 peptidoglycan DD-metalloendopeptidase family protein [Pseudoxanthomonas sp. PXM05]UBB24034.1 peptidoglycan DD-metalloendopeptidase family protein [Pseudoxanthomonas japonensis]
MTKATRALVLSIAVMAGLAACHSTVVRQTGSSGGGRIVSQPKYGQTVRVQRGDTLYGLAFRNGIDFRDLAAWNGIGSPYTIYPGQTLRLYPSSGSRPPASTGTATAGTTPRPTTPPATSAPKPPPPQAAPVSSGFNWRWPADGHVIGRFIAGDATKQGIDIAGSGGQAVRAAADGVVVYSGAGLVGYGELIIVKHSEAWLSAYGHNRKRLVNEGQNVKAGQQIAEMGSSGAAREMLHFEIRYNGKPVDPQLYLPKR